MSVDSKKIYDSAKWKKIRAQVLRDEPVCHWCKRRPATEADHLIELARGGDPFERSNLVGACKTCNSRRGSAMQAKQNAARKQPGVFKSGKTPTPPPLGFVSPKNGTGQNDARLIEADLEQAGVIEPRLASPVGGAESFGGSVAAWAADHLGVELMQWQIIALDAQLRHVDGKLVHREALISTARQNGKTVALQALAGWWLCEMTRLRGAPQHVVSTAHKLDRAFSVFKTLAPALEKLGGKVSWSYGRNTVVMPTGATWTVSAATPSNAHGGTYDLVVVDEVWNIGPDVIFDAYRPAMIARQSPLLSMWSTAGDEGSKVMMQLREQGLRSIEDNEQTTLCFMEWSPPPGADTSNPATWRWSNPALGTTITMEALKGASNTPDRQAFLRAHCNVWVSSSNSWLPHDLWDQLQIDTPIPAGGVLAVDNDLSDLRYVGVRAVALEDGRIQVGTEFVVTSAEEMWAQVETAMTDSQLQLALTPGLADLAPTKYARRMRTVGGQELYKYTSLVRNMALEKRLCHTGQLALAEHVNRAVAARSQNALTLSSMKSPGPIELARCMVWAAGIAAKPVSAVKVAQMGSSRV